MDRVSISNLDSSFVWELGSFSYPCTGLGIFDRKLDGDQSRGNIVWSTGDIEVGDGVVGGCEWNVVFRNIVVLERVGCGIAICTFEIESLGERVAGND